jgi:uncharacterized sulfatase
MAERRQIVFIMTDSQRKDMVGCYGNRDMRTPRLDRMAAEGMRFDRAYTCQPVCSPARSSLFTGTFPHTNGVWANLLPLGDNIKTVGQRLRDHGIRTAYMGKWHLDGSDYFGLGRSPDGWDPDYWYDMRNYLEEHSEKDRLRSRKPATCEDPDITEEFTYAHRLSNRALDFLSKHGSEEFLLVVSYDEPHHPFLCPRPYSQMYKGYEFPKSPNCWDRLEGKPEHHRVWAGERTRRDIDALKLTPDYYLGCNSFVDYEIGRVLDAIDAHAPDALVIYTSDHGDMLGSHCLGGKGAVMYEEITNIPLLVRWPGHTPAGSVCEHLASHIDIVPTILDAAGMPIPMSVGGRSMIPVFSDPDIRLNDVIFMEFGRFELDHDTQGGFQPVRCCFDGRYKLVINLLTSDELYDLRDDPQEIHNLIDSREHAAVRDRLHDRLLSWMNDTRDPFRGYYWERRRWRTDAREATWRYTGKTRQIQNEEYEPRRLDYATGLESAELVRGE